MIAVCALCLLHWACTTDCVAAKITALDSGESALALKVWCRKRKAEKGREGRFETERELEDKKQLRHKAANPAQTFK